MRLSILGLALLAAQPAEAASVSGRPVVIDGDTIDISGRRIRLLGIDAPEATQACTVGAQQRACGQAAAEHLRSLIDRESVTCSGAEFDQYGRLLAVCLAGPVELNRAMVAAGWATAFRRYSDAYVAEEASARAGRLGLWASDFIPPEDHRRLEDRQAMAREQSPSPRAQVSRPAGAECTIKGNRNRRGEWIYHLPGMPYYAQTRAEEMFCSEQEAIAAGYRRSRARR